MIGRILSATIAIATIAAAYFAGGGETAYRVGVFLTLPIACIWFGDSFGDYVGPSMAIRPYISKSTPGCMVIAGGWVLLFLPAITGLIIYLGTR